MSLLDDVMRAATATSGTPAGANPELDLVQQLLSHHGGVQGLADAFTRGGLGAQVQSRISSGANQPISGEQLVDVEESFQLWRFRHMKAVERIIGHRRGTGGSSGVGFLKKALDLTFFPELLEVRTVLGT